MIMHIVFLDGSKIIGERGFSEIGFPISLETRGTHHFTVLRGGDKQYDYLIDKEIAVPISSIKYLVSIPSQPVK